MLFLRSLAFRIAFYGNLMVWLVVCAPTMLLPRTMLWRVVRAWSASSNWLLAHVGGIRFEIRGRENLPKGGYIIASKHQSTWETISVLHVFPDPAFILKRELMWLPFFGWYVKALDMIAIDRGRGASAMKKMTAAAAERIAQGRQILIYPEGTRRPPGAEPSYKFGVARLYNDLNTTIVPVALNSGLYWPRRSFYKYPGTIVMEILPPIAPGLTSEEAYGRVQQAVEDASNRLIAEAARARPAPPAALDWVLTHGMGQGSGPSLGQGLVDAQR